MRIRAVLISLAACLGLTALSAWLFELSWSHALALAPVIVLVAGATAFLFVLWAKVAREAIRNRRGGSDSGV
jgi:ATP/ADP translocase